MNNCKEIIQFKKTNFYRKKYFKFKIDIFEFMEIY